MDLTPNNRKPPLIGHRVQERDPSQTYAEHRPCGITGNTHHFVDLSSIPTSSASFSGAKFSPNAAPQSTASKARR